MSIIQDELDEVKTICESRIPGSKIIACVPSMVRIDICKTKYKQLTACLQFPDNYPLHPLLIELKSKSLSEKFLNKLTKICEEECKKFLGNLQILKILNFLNIFLEENPFSVCTEELSLIKNKLASTDEIKLKQKSSSLILNITERLYFLKTKIIIPEQYYDEPIRMEILGSNFPKNFQKWFSGQSTEIARQCSHKPLKPKLKDLPFQTKPSLLPCFTFLYKEVKRYPNELCQLCKEKCFPDEPLRIVEEKNNEKHIEMVYCGHIFHNGCLNIYMKTPPFQGGKNCPGCQKIIYHEKWKVTSKLAEERWSHQEAKKRELSEVLDFFD